MQPLIPSCRIADKVTDVVGVRDWGLEQRQEKGFSLAALAKELSVCITALEKHTAVTLCFHLDGGYECTGDIRAEQ